MHVSRCRSILDSSMRRKRRDTSRWEVREVPEDRAHGFSSSELINAPTPAADPFPPQPAAMFLHSDEVGKHLIIKSP